MLTKRAARSGSFLTNVRACRRLRHRDHGGVRQAIDQWSASRRSLRTPTTISFACGGSFLTPESMGANLVVDADSAVLVGSRRFNATDYDVTLTRTLTNDTIFADTLGGPASD